jgi:small subunit ribosomal protein S20
LANIKSQIKRNRQNEKRRLRNRNFRGAARTAVKDAHTELDSAGENGAAAITTAISALDKAAQKGAIHPRNASRRKGRLMKQLAKANAAKAAGGPAGKTTAKKSTASKKSQK